MTIKLINNFIGFLNFDKKKLNTSLASLFLELLTIFISSQIRSGAPYTFINQFMVATSRQVLYNLIRIKYLIQKYTLLY